MSLSIKSLLGILLVSWLPFCESNTPEKLLTKKWKFASVDEVRKASSLSKEELGKNTKEERVELDKMLLDIYTKSSYEFRKNKEYFIIKDQRSDKGTWQFASEGKQLILTNNKGLSSILYVKDLTDAKLTLSNMPDSTGQTMTLVPF